MIGDGKNDIGAGKNAGCRTALIGENETLGADLTAPTLLEAVKQIIR